MSSQPVVGCLGFKIRLESGRYLDLLDPKAEDICLEDIAGALSRICRFGGQIPVFYSVAEHCWHCAVQAEEDGHGTDVQLAALFHDAAEAYVGDVVKPLKMLISGPYLSIEEKIDAAIALRFGLLWTDETRIAVKAIDEAMLFAERKALFAPDKEKWFGEDEARKLPRLFACATPEQARLAFTTLAHRLGAR